MTNTTDKPAGPVEIWLAQKNLEITCTVVREDETTTSLDVDSLSMRGGQREITGWLLSQGYKPAGRWETEAADSDGTAIETVRRFQPGPDARTV